MKLPPLYAILDEDASASRGWTVPDLARACFAGGAEVVQVRAKALGSGRFLAIVDEVVAAAPPGALVIVNDRADIARLGRAGGVHVGQDDLAPADVRLLLGDAAVIGLSTDGTARVDRALREPIDYVAVGPVFDTTTKITETVAVGLALVEYAVAAAHASRPGGPLPVVAIGGITLDRAPAVLAAGAASVAVISDLFTGGDPEARVREYVGRLGGARRS